MVDSVTLERNPRSTFPHCRALPIAAFLCVATAASFAKSGEFATYVAPVLERRCLGCHNEAVRKGGLSLATASAVFAGGENGRVIEPGSPAASYLLDLVTPANGRAAMPKDGDPLTPAEIGALRHWISEGAVWPEDITLKAGRIAHAPPLLL
ncbi:MAG: hypothetical protein M3552_01970 [Planctomycetota bacterium]|nr:hypothetical protein [Planctomycetaceae bacterium]MDQ3329413.1 hypothetical protein [Planctomycetota bacterium]